MTESEPRRIPLMQLLQFFEEQQSQQFCFILGAGASKSSGIPTGEELARTWFEEIRDVLSEDEFEKWVRCKSINENDLGRSYHQIFSQRFIGDPQYGYDALERLMENAEPSLGYAFLAKILAEGTHNIVITTNFDSLTEDALFIHTSKKPLVIGHSDLSGHISARPRRPQIIKVHHDLFLSPQNTEDDTKELSKTLEGELKKIFESYVPIIIGYGGNDGGFMGILDRILDSDSRIYWCIRDKENPSDDIRKLIKDKDGFLVPIDDFDKFMISAGHKMGAKWEPGKIKEVADKKEQNYINQMTELSNKRRPDDPDIFFKFLDEMLGREEVNWYTYELRASKETNADEKEDIYQEGLKKFPRSYQLLCNYANFLSNSIKDFGRAKERYRQSLDLAPNDPIVNGNYASFLTKIGEDYDQAEACFQKALEVAPNIATFNASYANFLSGIREDHNQAEIYYNKAIDLAPNDPIVIGNYANFLSQIRKDYDRAETYYKISLKISPDDPDNIGNYASFLSESGRDYDQAEMHYKKALDLAPNDVVTFTNYANFLFAIRKDYGQAEIFYQKALDLEPNNETIKAYYAAFLEAANKDSDDNKQ